MADHAAHRTHELVSMQAARFRAFYMYVYIYVEPRGQLSCLGPGAVDLETTLCAVVCLLLQVPADRSADGGDARSSEGNNQCMTRTLKQHLPTKL